MLVDVVMTRVEGRKLTAEELREAQPVRGHLIVTRYKSGDGVQLTATLHCGDSVGAMMNLPPLRDVRLHSWKGDSIMLHGTEFVNRQGKPGDIYPQGWWVRIVALDMGRVS